MKPLSRNHCSMIQSAMAAKVRRCDVAALRSASWVSRGDVIPRCLSSSIETADISIRLPCQHFSLTSVSRALNLRPMARPMTSLVPGSRAYETAKKMWAALDRKWFCTEIAAAVGVPKGSLCRVMVRYRKDFPARYKSPGPPPKREPKIKVPPELKAIVDGSSKPAPKPAFSAPSPPPPSPPPVRLGSRCLYPVGERPIRFECKSVAVQDYPYCEEHCRLCYVGFQRKENYVSW